MAGIWIQSLSWALICSVGQGLFVYLLLSLALRAASTASASARYYLALAAITSLPIWFALTWWSRYHALSQPHSLPGLLAPTNNTIAIIPTVARSFASTHLPSIAVIYPWLSACYVLGVIAMLVRLSAGMLYMSSLKNLDVARPDSALTDMLVRLKEKTGTQAAPRLLVSTKAVTPMVLGFFKPIILIPAATAARLTTEQLETILLHELAHLKRYDHIINMFQVIVETILFFNPFVWLLSAIIRREREHDCDDMVLRYTGEPLAYATALEAVAAGQRNFPTMALAATGEPPLLFNRIKRIMEMKKTTNSYSGAGAALLFATAIVCSIAWLPPVYDGIKNKKQDNAAEAKQPNEETRNEETILVQKLINDGVVDQVKGFKVEKQRDALYIDGKEQTAEVTKKYLSGLNQEYIRIEVFPFTERLKMHPDAGFMQLLLPTSFSSPCVDYSSKKKPGC